MLPNQHTEVNRGVDKTKQAQSYECACVVPAADVLANATVLGSSLSDAQTGRIVSQVEKCFAYFLAVLYHELHKPQFFSRTGPAARVSCGIWYLTQETDAEPAVYSHGINSTRVPSPLAVSGTSRTGGKNLRKPLRFFEAACDVYDAIQ